MDWQNDEMQKRQHQQTRQAELTRQNELETATLGNLWRRFLDANEAVRPELRLSHFKYVHGTAHSTAAKFAIPEEWVKTHFDKMSIYPIESLGDPNGTSHLWLLPEYIAGRVESKRYLKIRRTAYNADFTLALIRLNEESYGIEGEQVATFSLTDSNINQMVQNLITKSRLDKELDESQLADRTEDMVNGKHATANDQSGEGAATRALLKIAVFALIVFVIYSFWR